MQRERHTGEGVVTERERHIGEGVVTEMFS